MKHIFVIHSHISYISALSVLDYLGIKSDDVLFVTDHYKALGKINCFPVSGNRKRRSLIEQLINYLNPEKRLWHQVDEFVGEESFTAYVSVFLPIERQLVLHPKCKSFNFIEEGLSAYYQHFTLKDYTNIWGKEYFFFSGYRGLVQRLKSAKYGFSLSSTKFASIPLFYTAYIGNPEICFYGLSEKAYPTSADVNHLSIENVYSKYFSEDFCHSYDNCIVWIGDPQFAAKVGINNFYDAIKERVFPMLNGRKFYVRFHYRETEEQKQSFISFLNQNNIKFEIISNEQIMEFVFVKSKNCDAIGVWSSLLLYANILGQQSYSILNAFPERKAELESKIPVFPKLVKYV